MTKAKICCLYLCTYSANVWAHGGNIDNTALLMWIGFFLLLFVAIFLAPFLIVFLSRSIGLREKMKGAMYVLGMEIAAAGIVWVFLKVQQWLDLMIMRDVAGAFFMVVLPGYVCAARFVSRFKKVDSTHETEIHKAKRRNILATVSMAIFLFLMAVVLLALLLAGIAGWFPLLTIVFLAGPAIAAIGAIIGFVEWPRSNGRPALFGAFGNTFMALLLNYWPELLFMGMR